MDCFAALAMTGGGTVCTIASRDENLRRLLGRFTIAQEAAEQAPLPWSTRSMDASLVKYNFSDCVEGNLSRAWFISDRIGNGAEDR
jgi:hypothetical protein